MLTVLLVTAILLTRFKNPPTVEQKHGESHTAPQAVSAPPSIQADSADEPPTPGQPRTHSNNPAAEQSFPEIERAPVVTTQPTQEQWRKVQDNSELSIAPRRLFIRDPKPVWLDFSTLQKSRARAVKHLSFDLGLAAPVVAEIERVDEHSPDAYTVSGKIDGQPSSEFSVSVYADAAVGTFQSPEFGIRQLRYVADGIHKVETVVAEQAPSCGLAKLPPQVAAKMADIRDITPAADVDRPLSAADISSSTNPSTPSVTLDVLVAYTPQAVSDEGSLNAMLALINQGIADTNLAFTDSNIDARVRLVGTIEVEYSDTDPLDMLSRLRNTNDGFMDSVHGERNLLGADFVSMWAPMSSYCGVGYLPQVAGPQSADSGFTVVDPACQFQSTFTHELGHNFGCNHAVGDAGLQRGEGLYPYSHGWRWNGTNGVQYRSVMAYSPGIRLKRFSNPQLTHSGAATGRVNMEDNARGINEAKYFLSQYRGSTFDDHGDTAANATVIQNTVTAGELEIASDHDVFRFTVNTTAAVTLHSTGDVNTQADLRDAAQALIASDQNSGAAGNFSITATLSAGTYYLDLYGEAGSTGVYALHTTSDTSGGGDDHGNSITTATPFNLPGSIDGELEAIGDLDFFRIDVPIAGELTVWSLRGAGAGVSIDTYGSLLNSAGNDIVSDDNSGDPPNFSITRSVAKGTYYVRVRGSTSNITGEYRVQNSFVPGPDDHGNHETTATAVSVPSTTNGRFELSNDLDYFRIEVAEGSLLDIHSTGTTDTAASLRIYDDGDYPYGWFPPDPILTSDDNSGSGLNFYIVYPVPPGTYYVRVENNSTVNDEAYRLVVDSTLLPDDHGTSFPNATVVDPGPLGAPVTIPGRIDFQYDADIFRYTLGDPVDNPTSGGNTNVTLEFDSPVAPPPASWLAFNSFSEDGFTITNLAGSERQGGARESRGSNGSESVVVSHGPGARIEAANGKVFTPHRIDLSEYSPFFAGDPQAIRWTGYKVNGTTVSHTFTTDGLVDGPGGVADFQTFQFPASFANILSLEVDDICVFDNLDLTGKAGPALNNAYLQVSSSGSTDTVAELYDSLFRLIAVDDNAGDGDNFFLGRQLRDGTYYLKVTNQSREEGDTYSLHSSADHSSGRPPAPLSFSVTKDASEGVFLNWSPIAGANHYAIYRDNGGSLVHAVLLASEITGRSYLDASAEHGKSYHYWLVAGNSSGYSAFSHPRAGLRVASGPTITSHPIDRGVVYDGSATFTVAATSDLEPLSYQWYVGDRGDRSTPVGTGSPTLTLQNVRADTKVWALVSLPGNLGTSSSETATAFLVLPKPGQVTASKGLFTTRIIVRWLVVAGAESYRIYRNTTDSEMGASLIGSTAVSGLQFEDTTAAAGQDYYYFVRPVDPNGVETPMEIDGARAVGSVAGAPLDGTLLPIADAIDFIYSDDSSHLYVVTAAGGVDRYSIAGRSVTESLGIGHPFSGIDVDLSGDHLIAAQANAFQGLGRIHEFSFDQEPVTRRSITIPLQGSGTGVFDVTYLSSNSALAALRSPGATTFLREINLTNSSSQNRSVAGIPNGRVADQSFFSKLNNGQQPAPYHRKAAAFQAAPSPPTSAHWFGIDPASGQFGTVYTHSRPHRFGAANAVGSLYALVDDIETTIFDTDGNPVNTLPYTGAVAFSPAVDQLYLIDQTAEVLRTFSVRTWSEEFSQPIPGGIVSSASGVFGQGRLQIRPDGLQAAVSCGDGIRFFDISSQLPAESPLAPGRLTTGDTPLDEITLHWIGSTGATHYDIYRSEINDFSTSTLLAQGIQPPNFVDDTVLLGPTYYYWIVARNAVGSSPPGPFASASLLEHAPYNLSASRHLSDRVRVSWSFDGGADIAIEIFRSLDDQVSNAEPVAATTTRNFIDTATTEGVGYYYWARARFSPVRVGGFVGPVIGHREMPVPEGVTATTTSGSRVTVSWQASSNATEYEVYAGNNFSVDESDRLVGVTSATTIDDSWSNFPAGQSLYWAVRAKSGDALSLFSSSAFGRRILTPPTNVTASTESLDAILLTWTCPDDGQNEYRIFRSRSDNIVDASQVATVPAPTSQWADDNATANTIYYYWVRAHRKTGGELAGEPSESVGGLRVGGKFADFVDEFGLTGESRILTKDPDGDGRRTLQEWALGGTDPLSANDNPPLLLREITILDQTYPALCHLRLIGGTETANRYDALELSYFTEASSGNISDWTLIPVAVTPPADLPPAPTGYEWACFRLPGPTSEYPNGYLRLRLVYRGTP